LPSATSLINVRLVAATTRTSTFLGSLAPTGVTSPSCRVRSSLTWIGFRQLADFVEEQRSAVGGVRSGPVRSAHRAGERAPPVTEELGLDQFGRDGAAIDRDEGRAARGLARWMARAISSLPVPLSPSISTGIERTATRRRQRDHPFHRRTAMNDRCELGAPSSGQALRDCCIRCRMLVGLHAAACGG
jgi:hypothetical protein